MTLSSAYTLRCLTTAAALALGGGTTLPVWAVAPLPDGVVAHNKTARGAYSELAGEALEGLQQSLIDTWRTMCPTTQGKSLSVSGPVEELGKVRTQAYFALDRAAAYRTAYQLITMPNDPCTMRIEPRVTVRLVHFDGQRSRITDIDLHSRQGKQTQIEGRAPLLSAHAASEQAGPLLDAVIERRERIAGHRCEVRRMERRGFITEACLLADPALPVAVQGLVLQQTQTSPKGKVISRSTVTALQPDIAIDLGVFEVPRNVTLRPPAGGRP